MTTLTVGAGGQFQTIAAAVAASRDGDTVAVQAGTYVNDFAEITHKITLQGVGGTVNMVATEMIGNGKAILVTDTDVTIDRFSFSGATVADRNGAGIRYQGGNLVITNSLFQNNQNGILAASNPTGTITIVNSEFSHNGIGDGYTHGLYVGDLASLTIEGSYFHDASVGHEIKSRAEATTIRNSRITDGPTGSASYTIDLPNGGAVLLAGNVIEKGPLSQNPVMIAFGEEGNVHANSSLSVRDNTLLYDRAVSPSSTLVRNATGAPVVLENNRTFGIPSGQILRGPGTVGSTTALATEPALVSAAPWTVAGPQPAAPSSGGSPAPGGAPAADDTGSAVFRFFDTSSGTHFYTSSVAERDQANATRPDMRYEGVAFNEYATAQPGTVPVYRFFDSKGGTHFYTSSASERAAILSTRPDLVPEGIAFHAPTTN